MSLSASIRTGLYGAMQLVGSATVTGAAATTLTISGLDLSSDGEYHIRLITKNATASAVSVRMFVGSDVTTTNYGCSVDYANASTAQAARANTAEVASLDASAAASVDIVLRLDLDGKPRAFSRVNRGARATLNFFDYAWIYDTAGNVTAITFSTSVATAFAIGTYAVVYKIGAPVTSGTAFPTSGLVDGQQFFRTDLGLGCFYKASISLWLTETEFPYPVANQTSLIPVAGTSGTFMGPVPADYQLYLTKWDSFTAVNTTNSGTHYWTPTLSYLNAAGTNTNLDSFSTGTTPDVAANYYNRTRTLNVLLNSAARAFYLFATKTNAPGTLYYGGTVWARRVIP